MCEWMHAATEGWGAAVASEGEYAAQSGREADWRLLQRRLKQSTSNRL